MKIDHHESFQRMIDESLAGAISAEKEQSLREHLSTCAPCKEYLSASNRVIAGLSGFSFELTPTLNARVLVALKLQAQQVRAAQPGRRRSRRQHNVRFKVWAAFAVALSMSITGSALVYQVAKLLTVPMHFDTAQVEAGVLVFWLLPSFCAALCLLAAPGENRGIA
jgi:anti-sigma factor RsiW